MKQIVTAEAQSATTNFSFAPRALLKNAGHLAAIERLRWFTTI
jgi:hypothetical protein